MHLIDWKTAIETLENNTKQKDLFDRYEKQNIGIDWAIEALKALPSVEAIPVEWINGRIARLMEMDNAFASLTANQIRALLDDWRAQNEG